MSHGLVARNNASHVKTGLQPYLYARIAIASINS